jgi:hypothetical protein
MSKRNEFTRDEVERKQDKAVQFLRDVVGNDDLADEIDGLSVEEYAQRKKVRLLNPNLSRRENNMATSKREMTQRIQELEDYVGELEDSLEAIGETVQGVLPDEDEEDDEGEGNGEGEE